MLIPGLVTVTFRAFDRAHICETAKRANLKLLEWGGDIHVPPLDVSAAREAKSLSDAAGLTIDTYGSYYRCTPEENPEAIVETAVMLGARNIRVWSGRQGSADVREDGQHLEGETPLDVGEIHDSVLEVVYHQDEQKTESE